MSMGHDNSSGSSRSRSIIPAISLPDFQLTWRMAMKPMHVLMLAGIVLISPAVSHAQVGGDDRTRR